MRAHHSRLSGARFSELKLVNQQRILGRLSPLLVSLAILISDRLSKILVQHSMSVLDSIPVIPGWIRIVHTENPGAAFGVLSEGNPFLRSVVLIGVSTIVLIFVASALLNRRSSLTSVLMRLGLALILGGAMGNLYDRVVHGTVTDFFEVYHGQWSFPAFNVADSAITVGAALLLVDLLRPRRKTLEEHAGFAHE